MAVRNSSGNTPQGSTASKKRGSGIYDRALSLGKGEQVRPHLTLKADPGADGSLAFGSVSVMTAFGMAITIDDISVKVDDDGDIRVSTPFKAKPDKANGGTGSFVTLADGSSGYMIQGKPVYANIVRGEGMFEVMRVVKQAYSQCLTCAKRCARTAGSPYLSCTAETEDVAWMMSDGQLVCKGRVELEEARVVDVESAPEVSDAIAGVMASL